MSAAVACPFAVGFLGAGQMATALARGWRAAGLLDPSRSRAADPDAAARERFHAATGVTVGDDNCAVAVACDVLVLAVKPQVVSGVLAELRPVLAPRHLVVSIAAGVTLRALAAGAGEQVRLVRVMPNVACLVGAGAVGYALGPAATPDDAELVARLFEAVGRAFRLPESLLDAVTGLSGSGPAFIAVFVEALADGGVRCGLPRDVAQALAVQTVLGTARLLTDTGQHPAVLKDMVASPGGTTIAGLHELERGGMRAAVIDAVRAAYDRARELGDR